MTWRMQLPPGHQLVYVITNSVFPILKSDRGVPVVSLHLVLIPVALAPRYVMM